jgi:hypothetical protein
MTTTGWMTAAVLTVSVLFANVSAQGRGQGRGRSGGTAESAVAVEVVFRAGDRDAFRDYFLTHKVTAQPLPPGIAKRALPAGLLTIAPKVDRDVSLAIVGEVVVATKGGVVIDVLAGVFK